jgi:hypothetical protein
MVHKKDGSWRPCGDYLRLNLATAHNRYPLPSILDLSNKLHNCKFFSCIDLVKGYRQIPMAAQDIAKTAIITPFSLFEYLFMPFGLRNAAQTFQRFMDSLFKHLPFMFCYLDDIIIVSYTMAKHHELSGRSSPSFRRMACRSTQQSACSPSSLWSSWDTGWTSMAYSLSSGTYRPLVIFLPLRM